MRTTFSGKSRKPVRMDGPAAVYMVSNPEKLADVAGSWLKLPPRR